MEALGINSDQTPLCIDQTTDLIVEISTALEVFNETVQKNAELLIQLTEQQKAISKSIHKLNDSMSTQIQVMTISGCTALTFFGIYTAFQYMKAWR